MNVAIEACQYPEQVPVVPDTSKGIRDPEELQRITEEEMSDSEEGSESEAGSETEEVQAAPRNFPEVLKGEGEYTVNQLIEDERNFFIFCSTLPRWYHLNFDFFPIATCYPSGYGDVDLRRVFEIPRFTQRGCYTFASLQQEVATIQAHESRLWVFLGKAAEQRNQILEQYTKLKKALRNHNSLGLGEEFWGYRYYTYNLN